MSVKALTEMTQIKIFKASPEEMIRREDKVWHGLGVFAALPPGQWVVIVEDQLNALTWPEGRFIVWVYNNNTLGEGCYREAPLPNRRFTSDQGRQFAFHYNSFEPDVDYDDIENVKKAAKEHGEDSVCFYQKEDETALVEHYFHGRLEDSECTDPKRLEDATDLNDFYKLPNEDGAVGEGPSLVTFSQMNALLSEAGLQEIGELTFREEEEE